MNYSNIQVKQEYTINDFENIFCPICKCESFTDRFVLIDHIKICDKKSPDVPVIVSYGTVNQNFLNSASLYSTANSFNASNHKNILSENNGNIYTNQSTYFKSEPIIQNVFSTDMDEFQTKAFQCNICDIVYNNSSNLASHIKNTHSNLNSKIENTQSILSESFKSEPIVQNGLVTDMDEFQREPFRSDICNFVFNSPKNLASHITSSHNNRGEFGDDVIEVARLSNISGTKLKMNLPKTRTMDRLKSAPIVSNLTCPLCNTKVVFHYKSKKSWSQHLSRIHKHNSQLFDKSSKTCGFCKSACSSFTDLMTHYMSCQSLFEWKRSKKPNTKLKSMHLSQPSTKVSRAGVAIDCCMCHCTRLNSTEYIDHLRQDHNLTRPGRFPHNLVRHCRFCKARITSFKSLEQHNRFCTKP